MDASVSVRPKQTDMFARLKDIIVTNVDLTSIHKKVIKKMCFSIEIYFCFFVSGDVFNHLFSVYVVSVMCQAICWELAMNMVIVCFHIVYGLLLLLSRFSHV